MKIVNNTSAPENRGIEGGKGISLQRTVLHLLQKFLKPFCTYT